MPEDGPNAFNVSRAEFEALKALMAERDRRYEDHFKFTDEKTSLALSSSDKAVAKSETATEKRFDSVNEFRGQLKDQAATLLPRPEAEVKFSGITKDIDDLKKVTTLSMGRGAGYAAAWGIAVGLVFIGIALIGLLLKMNH